MKMSSTFLRRLMSGLTLTAIFVVGGCGGGGSESVGVTQPPVVVPAPVGTISGLVLSSDNASPIANASVSVGALSTKTAADGSFSIDKVPPADRAVVKLEASGYADGLAVVAVTADQTARATARLVRAAASVSIDPTVASNVTAAGSSARVALSANSLVNAATGAAVTGAVTASVTAIDPAADPQSMPGDYTTSNTATAERIESFGAIKVSLKDASGAKLNLKTGGTATIRIPLASRSVNPPASIPLFYLDETTGRWVQEGSATLTGTAPNRYYEGTVSHFSYWNADIVQDTIYVNGCVKDVAGLAIASATVTSTGVDYSGSSAAVSKTDGNFRVAIRKGGIARLFAEGKPDNFSKTVQVGPSNIDLTLSECLVVSIVGVAPSFVAQPSAWFGALGESAVFIGFASGSQPLKYQWRRNGVNIVGATYEYLITGALSLADSGAKFSVVVSNSAGSITSADASVTVNAPPPPPAALTVPAFTQQPASATLVVGQSATFTAAATGNPAPTFQWKVGGVNISGATSASYTTPVLTLADSGSQYSVVASNSQGSVTSTAVTLTVTALPPGVIPPTAPGGLYVGYYQEDPATNPEDAVPGAFSLNVPAANGAFSGSMYFTYIGCQNSNVGIVGGTKADLGLSGTWSGTIDGLAQNGAYTGSYSATTGSYTGTYTNAGGKQFRDLLPCIRYWIAPNGTWEMFPVDTQVPAGSLNIGITGRTLNWSVVPGASYALVYLLDESIAKGNGNPVVWQTLLSAGNSVAIPTSVALQSGKTYIIAVGISNSTAKRLAFGSKSFVQP
jgi:Carboxypeptidase regulatory-like domain/Immunoglobulin I-set domain